ncbi:MAG: hypothetical protein E7H33_09700 [Clostridium perfringens]|uniref:hypothetical protein n=1 Tax=Clostridium perfringens TaxID=1502 RepID=UPI00290CE7B4|nr:hypothetical protein [Clostridium perfringens]MDU4051178.1 hypothetical protein [Clostridium perfringens]
MGLNNCYEAMMRFIELDRETAEINNRMRYTKENSIQYNLLSEEADRNYAEMLTIKHKLQDIKMPIVVIF